MKRDFHYIIFTFSMALFLAGCMQTAQVSDVSPIESVKVIDFSECLDENSISPALQLSDDSVWFLSVRDETSNSIVYDLDTETVRSNLLVKPGEHASNDPRGDRMVSVDDQGNATWKGRKFELPSFSKVVPESISPSGNRIAYADKEKKRLMVFDFPSETLVHEKSLPFFCVGIDFLEEDHIVLSALEDSGESGLFAFNGQTGILSQLASGEYNVTSVNETKFLIRPVVGSTAPDSLFFLYLEGQEIKKYPLDAPLTPTQKMTIRLSPNEKFALTGQADAENMHLTVYETEHFRVLYSVSLPAQDYDCIMNASYQQISNDGEDILLLSKSWRPTLIRRSRK